MPELDGFQVVQAIRERERTAGGHLPVIALTARSRKEDRERCLAAGMDDFLTKPIRPAELLAAIDRLVRAPGGSHGVSPPGLQDTGERRHLLDPVALLTACGDDAEWLRGMCQDFQTYVPARLAEMGEALRDRDAPRLREAAHKLCALLSAFSTAAGDVASDLEDHAAQGRLDEAASTFETLADHDRAAGATPGKPPDRRAAPPLAAVPRSKASFARLTRALEEEILPKRSSAAHSYHETPDSLYG